MNVSSDSDYLPGSLDLSGSGGEEESDTQPLNSTQAGTIEDRKRKAEQLEWMECPVCLETPRRAPIYSCKKGHIICKDCQPRVTQCPTCRDKHVDCRSIIAEKLLETALKDYPLNCKFRTHGCFHQDLLDSLEVHETACMFRSVRCPANHRGACNWVGPLNKLIQHVIQLKCAQVVKAKPSNSYFVSTIGDFSQDQTVFSKSTPTHWKPVMLISQEALKFFCYAIFYRDASGYWYAYVRSFAPPSIRNNLRVEIKIKKMGQTGEQFVYTGSVASSVASEQEIRKEGNYLMLRDGQVKKFQVDKTIMEYNITISQVDAPRPSLRKTYPRRKRKLRKF
eukprot:TRINITY_DN13041_c0_g1_i10.p1 TRINITY_DN13041_c0_g1~~TRINITY_DN13041_c0_g1_i10.p1  ORF type:complete len:336 (+),score=47.14 TRINITY_DN13041_c0_g1_i10:128-1135(+)